MFSAGLATLVTYNPWTVSSDATLDSLVRMLQEMGFHHWPVVDEDERLVGIVSEVDIVRAVEERQSAMVAVSGGGPAEESLGSEWEVCRVDEIMSRRVVTIEREAPPREALRRLLENRIHSLPVVDESLLVGIVTSTDFLREFSYDDAPLCREPARDHMLRGAEPLDVNASLDEASEAFLIADTGYLSVVQGNFPLGVISQRDVRKARCRQLARELLGDEAAPGPLTVGQMVSRAPTLQPGQRLAEAAGLLFERQLQAVAVVNPANRLLGILSEDELLRAALAQA